MISEGRAYCDECKINILPGTGEISGGRLLCPECRAGVVAALGPTSASALSKPVRTVSFRRILFIRCLIAAIGATGLLGWCAYAAGRAAGRVEALSDSVACSNALEKDPTYKRFRQGERIVTIKQTVDWCAKVLRGMKDARFEVGALLIIDAVESVYPGLETSEAGKAELARMATSDCIIRLVDLRQKEFRSAVDAIIAALRRANTTDTVAASYWLEKNEEFLVATTSPPGQ